MLNRNKFWKATLGIFAEVLIAKQVDYAGTGASTVTDFPTFVTAALDGEFAFFNYDTLALIPQTTPTILTSSLYVFAALKRDGAVERTNKFRLQDYTFTRSVFAAALAQVSTATISGSPVAGHYYAVKILETTPGYQAFPRWEYGYTAVTGDTVTIVMTKIAALITDKTNAINKDTDPVIGTGTNSAGVLTLTAAVAGATFRVAFSSDALNDLAAVTAVTTNAFYGNGTYDQVLELENESNVYKGVTTNYPESGSVPSEYGAPVSFVATGIQYNIYIGRGIATESSPTPVEQHMQPRTLIFAIPGNGSANAEAEVKGALGL